MEMHIGANAPTPRPSQRPKNPRPLSPLRTSRQNSWRNSRGAVQNATAQLSPQFKDDKEIPIYLSVFFGSLGSASPQLDHARFSAQFSEQAFERKNTRGSSESFSKSLESSTLRALPPQQRLSQDLAAFEAIIQLAREFTDEVLMCVTEGCAICHAKARSLIHRPLSATRSGYFDLPDFSQTGRLMSIIASHTTHITEKAGIDWSIGNIANEKPYVCTLAVPICSADGECSRAAAQRTQAYIDGILEGTVKPNAAAAKFGVSEQTIPSTAQSQSFSSSRDGGGSQSDYIGDLSYQESSFATSDSDSARLYSVGTTVFVGKPSLQIDDRPRRGRLSCLVYSSSWPKSLLPGASKNEADDAIDYSRIAASHEELILESADYRCAVCSDVVAAGSLVHRPIAFVRTNAHSCLDESLRQLIMKLFQFVHGRWNFSAVNSALGSENDAHIFDYVVPICKSKTVCEEVAMAAAQEFIKLLLPCGMRLIFPGLDPDTDLKVFEGLFEDEFEWEPEIPRLLVSKLSSDGIMADGPDRGHDASDCSLTVSKLRQWYELQISNREQPRSSGDAQSAEYSDTDSDTASEIDESMVWVYVRSDIEDGTSQQSTRTGSQPRSESGIVKRMERQMLFEPSMSFDFWLVNEALGRGQVDMGGLGSTVDEERFYGDGYEDEASSQYSGDTEIVWQADRSL
ncbi:hypothetical protein PHISP_02115 [Aspergillus sp. HF37]|nr:hypothetical protein PHISP_02115 [Aspergillus sp. HF37]